MSRPGTIVTLSSLATAVVGIAVTTGAARLAGATSAPDVVPSPTRIDEPPTVELPLAVIAAPQMPMRPASADAGRTGKVVESEVGASVSESRATPTSIDRRDPFDDRLDGDGGLMVGDDHAPQIGEIRYFNGRPIRAVRTMRMRVTAYSPDHRSCGVHADGITASGYSVDANGGRLVAADRRMFPFGSLVSVPGYGNGQVVPVLDRGGAIKGARLDVLYPTHGIARRWGVRNLDIMVWEYADGEPIGFSRPRGR